MVTYLYNEAFSNGFFGTAAASAVMLLIATIFFSILIWSYLTVWVETLGKNKMSLAAVNKKKPDDAGIILKILFYIFMIAGALVSIFPFYWMFVIGNK